MAERKDDISEDRPFLSRWSERKRSSEFDADGSRPDTDTEQAEGADAGRVEEEQAANQAAAEAIDIDSLNKDSDYSPFLKDGVPPALKSAALQRLWRSSPIFANIDGLNDYDEDFTIPKTPMGAIRTAWKFGRGFVTDDDDADKGETVPDPQAAGSGEDVAEAVTSEPDPEIDDDRERDPAPQSLDSEPAETGPEDAEIADIESPGADLADATGKKPDADPAPGVGLRNRLDIAAFSGRDDD
jgi:hypothetical protein